MFHIEDQRMLGTNVENSVMQGTWCLEYVHCWHEWKWLLSYRFM